MDSEISRRFDAAEEAFTQKTEQRFGVVTKEIADDIDKVEQAQSKLRVDGTVFQDRMKEAILTLEQQINNAVHQPSKTKVIIRQKSATAAFGRSANLHSELT